VAPARPSVWRDPVRGSAVPLSAGVAAAVSARAITPVIARAPSHLVRTNISGKPVPAVLGAPLVAGAVAGMMAGGLAPPAAVTPRPRRVLAAGAWLCVALGAAGYVDDRRGDEAFRGFAGHLRALARGRVTGGAVKMAAGALGGLAAGGLVAGGRTAAEVAASVALCANWINLLDRAPGRAAKVAVALGCPLVAVGTPAWRPVGAALLGALGPCLPPDLGERAMLGDAGANALGAVLGLGLALSLRPRGRRAAISALAALTLISERWSYSGAIERVGVLAWVDCLGRGGRQNPPPPC
jgi:UDP-GlcNAc:undecaprenyl-phosphate GlcNAc-1-phosphate transferase